LGERSDEGNVSVEMRSREFFLIMYFTVCTYCIKAPHKVNKTKNFKMVVFVKID